MTDAATCLRWLEAVGISLLLAAAVFVAFPWLDLDASRVFGNAGQGFPAASQSVVEALRMAFVLLPAGVALLALAALGLNLLVPALRVVETRVLAFAVSATAIGPGLIVNGLLKSHSGRPRPRDIVEFGGHHLYVPPFDFTGSCSGNCSFVSAETSAVATVAVVLALAFVPALPAAWRTVARVGLAAIVSCGGFLRVAMGAHFVSDVIFAALGVAGFVVLLYLAFGLHRLRSGFVPRPRRLPRPKPTTWSLQPGAAPGARPRLEALTARIAGMTSRGVSRGP